MVEDFAPPMVESRSKNYLTMALEEIAQDRIAWGDQDGGLTATPDDGLDVLLGVTGGIAAYRAAELVRLLVRDGLGVQVVLTPAARRFVGETTFAGLSRRPVLTDRVAAAVRSTRTSTPPAPRA